MLNKGVQKNAMGRSTSFVLLFFFFFFFGVRSLFSYSFVLFLTAICFSGHTQKGGVLS